MKNRIKTNLDNAVELEKLFRDNKKEFEKAFYNIYDEIKGTPTAYFWKSRLDFSSGLSTKTSFAKKDILVLLVSSLFTGFLIKIPQLFEIQLNDYFFYEKNAGLIVLLGLTIYAFATKNILKPKLLLISALIFLVSAIYINLLPSNRESHSIMLAYIHLPFLLWCVYGIVFIEFNTSDKLRRIDFIKYNGDIAILGAIILIAGGILSGVTIGLFEAIDLHIQEFYFDYIVVVGLVSAPIVATFIIRHFPSLVHKIAPIIANLFSPLVLLTLSIYLIGIIVQGKDPYNDREFLMVFNLMLIGVMAILVFSVSETSGKLKSQFNEIILLALVCITLIIDSVALSAIVYRLGEFGFTPNRTALLGFNILVFVNLVFILIDLFKVNFKKANTERVEMTVAKYLPVYMLWTIFVVFILPLIFHLK